MGRGDHLASDQLFDRNGSSLPIGLLRLEKPVQSIPEIAEDLGFRRGLLLGKGCEPVETFFEVHHENPRVQGFKGSRVQVRERDEKTICSNEDLGSKSYPFSPLVTRARIVLYP
jgi:hypothetical protein